MTSVHTDLCSALALSLPMMVAAFLNRRPHKLFVSTLAHSDPGASLGGFNTHGQALSPLPVIVEHTGGTGRPLASN